MDRTSMNRIERLKANAGAAGDEAQVAMCDKALAGDVKAVAECLAVCRYSVAEGVDHDALEAGDYLAEYWDGEDDPGSRCGYSDSALANVRRTLARRGLTLATDDVGIRVVAVEVQS